MKITRKIECSNTSIKENKPNCIYRSDTIQQFNFFRNIFYYKTVTILLKQWLSNKENKILSVLLILLLKDSMFFNRF